MTWTHTSRGRALDLLDPKADDIDLDEVALALSNQCRYAGCIRHFYSVAEHCVLLARWLGARGCSRDVQLAGLLHDGAEAYTGDITWPMQQVLWGDDAIAKVVRERYRRCQWRLDQLIAERAGLRDAGLMHCHAIKEADLRILLDERAVLLTEPPPRPWPVESEMGLTPLGVEIECLDPFRARLAYVDELRRLGVRS